MDLDLHFFEPSIITSDMTLDYVINDNIDLHSFRQLYGNCKRGGDNISVEIATFHPKMWFGYLFKDLDMAMKMSVKSPAFVTYERRYVSNVLSFKAINHMVVPYEFNSDDDLKSYLQTFNKALAIYSLIKYIDLSNFSVKWVLRAKDIKTINEKREDKLTDILK